MFGAFFQDGLSPPTRTVKNGCHTPISGISPKRKLLPQGFSN